MGKLVETKKKRGRPSLLDLQKRRLQLQEQQEQQQLKKSQQSPKTQNHTPSRIHHQNPSSTPNTIRRSTRRNPNSSAGDDDVGEVKALTVAATNVNEEPAQQQQLRGKRKREKELKLPNSDLRISDCNAEDGNLSAIDRRKRKIDAFGDGSGVKDVKVEEKHVAATNQANTSQEDEDGPSTAAATTSTPLPDKKLLLFILERLQKKDTYGVFAEPVDAEELPDYHEVVSQPMDFSTVRKKLATGAYANLEQFEQDVFLISSNAMQYNAPDTIYFRQARSIQELAKKCFENLRQDSEDEPETKIVRRGRPPILKNLKKAFRRQERANSEVSEATLASGGENTNRANHNQKRGSNMDKHSLTKPLVPSYYNSHRVEANSSCLVDRYDRNDKLTGSASKGISATHGKRVIMLDESRRNSFEQSHVSAGRQEPSVFSVFDWDRKMLIPVGLHTEHGYARSLARFAAKLGSVAWKVASRKINRCLPSGVEFGPGWVGVNDVAMQRPLPQCSPTTGLAQHASPHGDSYSAGKPAALISSANVLLERARGVSLSEEPVSSCQSKLETHSGKLSACGFATASVSSVIVSSVTSQSSETDRGLQPQTVFNVAESIVGSVRPGIPSQPRQNSVIQPHVNGTNGTYGSNGTVPTRKLTAAAKPSEDNLQPQQLIATISTNDNIATQQNHDGKDAESGTWSLNDQLSQLRSADQQNADPVPADLDVGFQSPSSLATSRVGSINTA